MKLNSNKEKLKKQILIIDSIFVLFVLFVMCVSCFFIYIILNKKMDLILDFLGMTYFELVWYSPYIFIVSAIIFSIIYIIIISLRTNLGNKLNSILFEEGRSFKYNKNGLYVVISKNTDWTCYKNTEFVKNDFSINISSCELIKLEK